MKREANFSIFVISTFLRAVKSRLLLKCLMLICLT